MRHKVLWALLPVVLAAAGSCDKVKTADMAPGNIKICFSEDAAALTRASLGTLDTNKFILTVTSSSGGTVYNGLYGNAPENIIADPGTYTISVVSCEFSEPLFDKPQFGDTQVAVVNSGESCSVRLSCVQQNAGMRLRVKETFLVTYPDATLYLKSSTGSLAYAYDETRTAYFQPGTVNLVMNDNGANSTLFTRVLTAQQMLTVNVNAGYTTTSTSDLPEGITIEVDTTRNWTTEDFVYGDDDSGSGGSEISGAYSVGQARSIGASGGETSVWVYGYIVGGDCSSSSCSFSAPFTSATNIVLAAKTSCVDKNSCISVALPKGDIRDALNLVDHPDLIGRQVFVKGNIVSAYYGIPGVKSLTEYYLN